MVVRPKKFILCCVLVVCAMASAWAGPIVDPNQIDALKPGETTVDTVTTNFGKPDQEDHSPDGRFVYLYSFDFSATPDAPAGMVRGKVALLFGPDGRFLGARFYGENASGK